MNEQVESVLAFTDLVTKHQYEWSMFKQSDDFARACKMKTVEAAVAATTRQFRLLLQVQDDLQTAMEELFINYKTTNPKGDIMESQRLELQLNTAILNQSLLWKDDIDTDEFWTLFSKNTLQGPLCKAVELRRYNAMQQMCNSGIVSVFTDGFEAMKLAVDNKDLKMIKLLNVINTAGYIVSTTNDVRFLKAFLELGEEPPNIDTSWRYGTPIEIAVSKNNPEMVQMLLDHNCIVDDQAFKDTFGSFNGMMRTLRDNGWREIYDIFRAFLLKFPAMPPLLPDDDTLPNAISTLLTYTDNDKTATVNNKIAGVSLDGNYRTDLKCLSELRLISGIQIELEYRKPRTSTRPKHLFWLSRREHWMQSTSLGAALVQAGKYMRSKRVAGRPSEYKVSSNYWKRAIKNVHQMPLWNAVAYSADGKTPTNTVVLLDVSVTKDNILRLVFPEDPYFE